jgi:micrococcal nuclease
VERYGKEAANFTKKILQGRRVRLEYDVQPRDRYGRILAYVYLEDGTFFNAELVRQGYARIATYPPNVKHADEFVRLEREAREANRGLWAWEDE